MIIIPIRTESVSRDTPVVNYVLILVNIALFLLLNVTFSGSAVAEFKNEHLAFRSIEPAFHQFLTYQFLHADAAHLLGNLLFLWVFGNSVNGKMGHLPYLLFYLGGGIFAAWGHAVIRADAFQMVGASGAIAAVTTAYLALFPRSRVTVLVWLFFIYFFACPAMVLIGLKIIVWDNLIAPSLGGSGGVAHSAHLAGYFFGFAGSLFMLYVRAIPRDQFDILALWRRWFLRREFRTAMADPAAAAQAKYGSAARVPDGSAEEQAAEVRRLDELAALRTRIGESLERGETAEATALHEQLIAADPQQCLSEQQQLGIARAHYEAGRFEQAAGAFDRLVECYANSPEATNVQLLCGIVYARDLRKYELADKHLTKAMKTLKDEQRRTQCLRWLRDVRAALGREVPEMEADAQS